MENKKIILGLDVSTACIGYCLYMQDDEKEYGNIIKMGHIAPKIPKDIKGIESLFVKKKIFNDDFLSNYKTYGIEKVVIEEPLLSSNNANTVATLLRFNGMISDCVYCELGIVPEYISSYDARKYAFPDLLCVRKFNKKGEHYPKKKLLNSLKKDELILFGSYPFDISKKLVMWNKVVEIYNDIDWVLDKKGELKKENFDATDALIACLGYVHKLQYGELEIKVTNIEEHEDKILYEVEYWGKKKNKEIYLD